ncbi:MAG: thiosulfate oxidation carrier protein SoxY [Gammaproteobacteria bacterium]|nr:thiosulfate oxidation carrier protein SoxY [Gammaproteobacteria bacterium]
MNFDVKRRLMLKGSMAAGLATVAAAAGLLSPTVVLAAWPKAAFEAKSINNALSSLLGSSAMTDSGDVKIKAPSIAENGAVVNVVVKTKMSDVESISILVEKNGNPLAFSADLAKSADPFVKTRVKLGQTSKVIGVIKAGGKIYSASRIVKVTVGGCGG